MSENQVRKLRTRCYYTDYVNHAIRFFLSTPDTLHMEGKRKSDMEHKAQKAEEKILKENTL